MIYNFIFNLNRKDNMRIRLNSEYRNKIASRMRVHLRTRGHARERKILSSKRRNETTYKMKRGNLLEEIVSRHYTPEDIKMAYHLQNKFENVDTIAKDSCFHFGYQGQVEDRDENDKVVMKDKYIESHFDFKLEWKYQW